MSISRRNLVASAAALPALAVPAVAMDNPDAELLALNVRIDETIQEWNAQTIADDREHKEWSRLCLAAGLPALDYNTTPFDEFVERNRQRTQISEDVFGPEKDENDMTAWDRHNERWHDIISEILSHEAQTPAGLGVQVRAITLYATALWDEDREDGDENYARTLMEIVCKFTGVRPAHHDIVARA